MSDNLRIVSTMQVVFGRGGLALALLLGGCATIPDYNTQDVETAAQQGQLETMFQEIEQDLSKARPGSEEATALTLVRNDVARRLSMPYMLRINELVNEAKLRRLSLSELAELDTAIATIKPWKPYQSADLANQAAEFRELSEAELADLKLELNSLDEDDVGKRYVASMRLAALEGGEQADALKAEAAAELEQTYQAGVAAVERKQLSEAELLLTQVAYAEPDYKDLVYNQELVATGLFEQHFWQTLVDGQPDEAFELFYEFSRTSAFSTHRNKIEQDAAELAQYFDVLGDKWRGQGDWLESYRAFHKASFIRATLELPDTPSNGLRLFTEEMERRHNTAARAGKQSVAFAYLSVIESLNVEHGLLSSKHRSTYEAVFDMAVVKLSLPSFAGEFGEQISDSINHYLVEHVPNELRIIDSKRVEQEGQPTSGEQSWYELRGEVTKAEVEQMEATRNESRSVVTGTRSGPNPEYEAWRDLPRSERSAIPEPPRTANLPVYQYASFAYTDITRDAVLSTRFEVVELLSGEVAFADTVSDGSIREGSSIEPFSLGGFTQEAVAAELPSEREQLTALAESVSHLIGEILAQRVQVLEGLYETKARTLSAENKASAAVEQWAYAYVVSEPNTEENIRLRREMEEAVLK